MRKQLAFHQALADPTRLRIAALLRREALCVCELADVLELPQSTVSTHLQWFKTADLVETERCDKWVYYRLQPLVSSALDELQSILGTDPEESRQWKSDLRQCTARLKQRAASCCRGPSTGAKSTPRRGVRPQSPPLRLAGPLS